MPAELGRGVVVDAGDPVPAPWSGAPEIVVDGAAAVDDLHRAWARRTPVVVRLAVDPATFREPSGDRAEPWTLRPDHDVAGDRLHFLVWANTYDARGGKEPVWWWGRKAARLGATEVAEPTGDIALDDGTRLWVDGGPRGPLPVPHVHRETVDLGLLRPAPAPVAPSPAIPLAPDQLAAVAHGSGPARVIAPAGSGKTRVLTERLRHLLGDRGWERETVLAVAYNRKAREELAERCAAFGPRVVTLNALGWELLGRPPVLDERDVRRIVEGLAPRMQRRANTDPYGPYLEALAAVRLGLRDPEEVEGSRDDVPGFAALFGPYRAELRRRGVVDFDEQVYAAVERLLADGPFRQAQQARHRHLLVDELQDLTPCHVLLIRLLASPGLDVFGVGDDDQVIYGHAGADPSFLIDFDRYFPAAASHPLEVNYRCPDVVVGAARHLLSYNDRRVPKEIRPGPDAATGADRLRIRRHRSQEGGSAVLATVQAWLDDGADPATVAVLSRVNSLLLAPHVVLAQAGVPVDSAADPSILERTGVRAALAYLRIAAAPRAFSPDDVIEVLRRPSRGLPTWISKWFRGRSMSVGDVRAVAARLDDVKVAAKVESLADDLDLVAAAADRSGTARDVLTVVKEQVGLGSAMGLLDATGPAGSGSHLDDLEALLQVADLHPDPGGFEPWLRSVFRREAVPGGVTVSTVHRVKGMEWDRVAIFGVADGIVPHRLADDIEEERRVLHVAITRGRRRVVLLADADRPSPFLGELDGTAPRRPSPPPRSRTAPAAKAAPAKKGATSDELQAALPAEAAAVFAALREWRTAKARQEKVSAFIVAPNRLLQAIAVARPTTMAELSHVHEMGARRLESYGDEILAVVDAAATP